KTRGRRCRPTAIQRLQNSPDAEPGEARYRRRSTTAVKWRAGRKCSCQGGDMPQLIQWATSPWGKSVPIHIAWDLIWIAVIAGLSFMIVHALYLIIVKPPKRFAERKAEANAAAIPERVPRHTLAARLFHWIMA